MNGTHFDEQEQFIHDLCEQIRHKPARQAIADEYRAHLDELTSDLIAEGLEPSIAAQTAVSRMGDPAEIGRALNRAHRPRVEWSVLLLTVMLMAVGIATQWYLAAQGGVVQINFYWLTATTAVGIIALGCFMFVNGTVVQRYASIVYGICAAAVLAYCFYYSAGYRLIDQEISRRLPMLLTPVLIMSFAGLITQGNSVWKPVAAMAVVILPISLVNLPLAVVWGILLTGMTFFDTKPGKSLTRRALPGILCGTTGLTLIGRFIMANSYLSERLMAMLHPRQFLNSYNYAPGVINDFFTTVKLFGSADSRYVHGEAYNITQLLPEYHRIYVLSGVAAMLGWVAAAAISAAFVLFLLRVAASWRKIGNPYYRLTACGVCVSFAVQILVALPSSLGLTAASSVYLPFVAYDGIGFIANAATVGLLLGAYRCKNIVTRVLPVTVSISLTTTHT